MIFAGLKKQELQNFAELKNEYEDSMFQLIESIRGLKKIMGESCIARDLEKTIDILQEIWCRTSAAIDDFRAQYPFTVHCAVCGEIGAAETYAEAVELGKDHEQKMNRWHVCLVIG